MLRLFDVLKTSHNLLSPHRLVRNSMKTCGNNVFVLLTPPPPLPRIPAKTKNCLTIKHFYIFIYSEKNVKKKDFVFPSPRLTTFKFNDGRS